MVRILKRLPLFHAVVATMFLMAPGAGAEPQSHEPHDVVALELNKLEASDKGCRAYVVINNQTDKSFQSYKIDLVLFQSDGIIGRRFSIDLAPLRPKKRSVKLFDIDGMSCDKIGSLLINDVMDCKSEPESVDSCLRDLSTSSLTNVQLSK